MLDKIIICFYKYVDLASKFLIKMHTRKEPPLAIGLLLHHGHSIFRLITDEPNGVSGQAAQLASLASLKLKHGCVRSEARWDLPDERPKTTHSAVLPKGR